MTGKTANPCQFHFVHRYGSEAYVRIHPGICWGRGMETITGKNTDLCFICIVEPSLVRVTGLKHTAEYCTSRNLLGAGGYKVLSSILADQWPNSALVYEPNCEEGGGGDCGASANEYSCVHGAQIIFVDLTPNLIYGSGREMKNAEKGPWLSLYF